MGIVTYTRSAINALLALRQLSSEKDQANGYAGRNASGHIVGPIITRSGTAAVIDAIVLADGEVASTTDTDELRLGDGATAGGTRVGINSSAVVIVYSGNDLVAKYTAAKALTPNGAAKSATNRATLLVMPGAYAFTSTIAIDTQFVDIFCLGNPTITFTTAASFTPAFNQSVDDARLFGPLVLRSGGVATGTIGVNYSSGLAAAILQDVTFSLFAQSVSGTPVGLIRRCRSVGTSSFTFAGLMEGCHWEVTDANATALSVTTGAKIRNSTLLGTGTGKSIDAASAATVEITNCVLNNGIGSNVTNSVAFPANANSATTAALERARLELGTAAVENITALSLSLGLKAYTTVERDALTPSNGWVIYNSTLGLMQTRENGAWVSYGTAKPLINLLPDLWMPPSTAHPDRGMAQNRTYWAFDAATLETLYSQAFQIKGYAGGTLYADIDYCMATATSGAIKWNVSVEAVTVADALALNSASSFDTANSTTGTVLGTAGYRDKIVVTLTNKDSVAEGDMVRLKLDRDAANASDTAAGDALLFAVTLRET